MCVYYLWTKVHACTYSLCVKMLHNLATTHMYNKSQQKDWNIKRPAINASGATAELSRQKYPLEVLASIILP